MWQVGHDLPLTECMATSVDCDSAWHPAADGCAVTHIGADLCMRACYLPETWALRVFLCDSNGRPKVAIGSTNVEAAGVIGGGREGAAGSASDTVAGGNVVFTEGVVQDIAGPLCFQGDRLVVGQVMPKAAVGDYVMVADTGAYTLSMYSRCDDCVCIAYSYWAPKTFVL